MKKIIIKEGDRFGRLSVIEELECPEHLKPHRLFSLLCDCGNTTTAYLGNLRSGLTQSCGCYRHERQVNGSTIHGMSNTRIWRIWVKMVDRCVNPENDAYKHYGGRGISVCEEWYEFTIFYRWASSNGYQADLTIDRIDVNGNYCPQNCRWTTMVVQQNNRRNNIRLLFNEQMMTIPEICRGLNLPKISHRVVWQRIHRDGLSLKEALSSYKEYVEQVLLKP